MPRLTRSHLSLISPSFSQRCLDLLSNCKRSTKPAVGQELPLPPQIKSADMQDWSTIRGSSETNFFLLLFIHDERADVSHQLQHLSAFGGVN